MLRLPTSLDELLANFGNPAIRPGLSGGYPGRVDVVDVVFGVDELLNIEQTEKLWGMTGFHRIWWNDPRLKYNESVLGPGLDMTEEKMLRKVWRPSLYWEKPRSFERIGGQVFLIRPNGDVVYSQHMRIVLHCDVSFTNMPFDTQRCEWWNGVFNNGAENVQIRWRPNWNAFDNLFASCPTAWVPTSQVYDNRFLVVADTNYSYAWAEVSLTRRAPWSMMETYFFGAFALVFLSFLGTFVNPHATPARVALGVITILSVRANYLHLIESMP